MKFRVCLNLILVTLLFSSTALLAQQPTAGKGSVSGKLLDGANNQPLSFATVAIVKKADNLPAKSIQTDIDGNFKLGDIPDGFYLFRATYVGYATFIKDSIRIDAKRRVYTFPEIKLIQAKGLLKEVAIKSAKSQMQLGIDRKTFAVDQSLVSQGGSATDLLSNVPSVQVDVDGNVNLRGSANVRVLINGKPSTLTGGSVADILQSIPASAIENVEVITNPSSKYDAEGQSGIINIVLKKNARLGFNGSVSGTAGNQNSYNGNLNLAYQTSKYNFYLNYSYRRGDRVGNGYTNRTTYLPTGPVYQNQIADQSFGFRGSNIRGGVDINFDPKTTLSFSANVNLRNRDRSQYGTTDIRNSAGALTRQTIQNSTSHSIGGGNNDFGIDFNHKYKKQGEELTANIGYSNGYESNIDVLDYFQTNLLPASANSKRLQRNINGGDGYSLNLQADYTLPLSKGRKLEAGYRSTIGQNNNNNNVDSLASVDFRQFYSPDLNLTNHFLYREQVHAVYTNYQMQFGKFGVQTGVRIEDVFINTLLRDNGERHNQNYFRIYPSIFLSDKLSDNQTIQLSYTRRVQRPRDRQLSPFLDKSDPFNYNQGNPNLRPEDTHSFELSYINYWKTLTLTSSLYYRLTNDNIQQIRTPIDSVTTRLHFENVTQAQNSGFELIAKVNATNALDLTANTNVYYRYLQGVPTLGLNTSSGFAWNANLTANYKPVKSIGIQIKGDYIAPQVISQGRQRAMAGLDAGIKYDITKAVSLSGNVRDAFNTRKFGSIIDNNLGTTSVHSESVRRFQSRTYSVTLSYRFGSTPGDAGNKKKKKDGSPDDNNGGDDGNGAGGVQGTINGGGAAAATGTGAKPPVKK